MRALLLVGLLLVGPVACNDYELLRTTGSRGEGPPGADVLFVVDRSESMTVESLALASSAAGFAGRLAEGSGDLQVAITTMDASATRGALVGGPFPAGPDLAGAFERALLCDATCFRTRDEVPSDPDHVCGDPHGGEVTAEYLDCLCGDDWVGDCGRDDEEGLEAVLLAMCRAVPEPPAVCWERPEAFGPDDVLSNEGLLTSGHTLIPVLITDEGDSSPRIPDYVAAPDPYVAAFRAFGVPMSWAVVLPALDDDLEVVCPGVATSWGVLRYEVLAETTGGMRADLYGPDCGPADLEDVLARVGDLVVSGPAAFPLQGPADPETITVFVDGEQVPRAWEGAERYGVPRFGDGWSYRRADHTVVLHGEAIPPVRAEVAIYYRPE